MNCKEFENKILFYIEGELKPDEKKQMDLHLETCEKCRFICLKMQKTLAIIGKEKQIVPNPFLKTRILEKMSKQETPVFAFNFNKIFQPVMMLVIMCVGIYLGIMIGKNSIPGQTEKQILSEEIYFTDFDNEPIEPFLLME